MGLERGGTLDTDCFPYFLTAAGQGAISSLRLWRGPELPTLVILSITFTVMG